MKKFIIVFLLFIFTINLSFAEKIKIGVSTPLTGDAASYGTDIKNLLVFANDELANNQYKLIIEDDKCLPRDGVTVANKLVNQDQVRYVFGTCSSTVLSSHPIYEKNKVIQMATFASAPKISDLGDYLYRTFPSDAAAGKLLAKLLSRKHKKVAMISAETDYAQGFREAFLANKGNLEVEDYSYIEGSNDFRSLVTKVLAKQVEAIFINSQTPPAYIEILKSIKKLKVDMQVYSAYWPASDLVKQQVPDLNEGSIYVSLGSIDAIMTTEAKDLRDKFKNKFGKLNTLDSAFVVVFEAFRAIHQAIQAELNDENRLNYLNNQKFSGTFGEWSFDENGDIQGLDFSLWQIKDGQEVAYQADI